MAKRKLDEKEKSRKNVLQQIQHTEDRIRDAEIAMENEPMSPERKEELKVKNEHRRESIEQKKDEL
ncbi:MAG: hypothetical protein WAP20_04665 [Limnochordia bacterium]|jgi:hypothetical protein|nr:hypothetical protein [Bacillota bacterium]HOB08568.1 hypothetical protein [Limnochordia bacterium]NLH31472.1 hypothetical protein [Bacillota bacterium]HPT92716.1 hypothetical protein [Limnochordia bacterium]HPZ30709.1 hypothetical protein [Limnochordia bacterium]